MLSRDRVLTTINHQEPDRVPIFFRGVPPLEHLWHNTLERVDRLLELGVDEKVGVSLPFCFHPDVKTRLWRDENTDPRYTLVGKEFHTPKGTLKIVVRATEDCPYDNDVPIRSDHNISRATEFLIKGPGDLDKLAYLLYSLSPKELSRFYEYATSLKSFARQRGVLLDCTEAISGGDLAAWLCGQTNLLYMAHDNPGFVEELMNMIHKWEMERLETILDFGVHMIDARGCYETAPLWSPALFDKLFAPLLQEAVEITHQAGAKFSYYSTGSVTPHFSTLKDIGVDVLCGMLPPPGGDTDMRVAKEQVGDKICLWGGIDPAHVIERGTKETVRRKVMNVIRVAASGGGFVLATGGSILDKDCYENVKTFIETAREFGSYPMDIPRDCCESYA